MMAARHRSGMVGGAIVLGLFGPVNAALRTVVSQFASELLDAFEQKIQTETLP
jgi:hypothetical protein